MSNKDFIINVTATPNTVNLSKKPLYLIALEDFKGKAKVAKYFISIDKPDLQVNFIQVKGIYCELEEEDILKNFSEIMVNTSKESIVDMMFPSHRIYSIRSLVFNANKPSTLIR